MSKEDRFSAATTFTVDRTRIRIEVEKRYINNGLPMPSNDRLSDEVDVIMRRVMGDMQKMVETNVKDLQEQLQKISFAVPKFTNFDLAPGNKAINTLIDAFEKRERERQEEVEDPFPSEPQIDDPVDEVASYREVPRQVVTVLPPPPTLFQRIINWFRSL